MKNLSFTVMGTYKIEDGMFVYEGKGTFTHRDINAEYKEDAKFQRYLYKTFIET